MKTHCTLVPQRQSRQNQHSYLKISNCTPAGRYSNDQGQLPSNFWTNVELKTGKGHNGEKFVQRELTVTLPPELLAHCSSVFLLSDQMHRRK